MFLLSTEVIEFSGHSGRQENLQRMLQAIPLLDDERAAVEEGLGALEKLLQRLENEATPDKKQEGIT